MCVARYSELRGSGYRQLSIAIDLNGAESSWASTTAPTQNKRDIAQTQTPQKRETRESGADVRGPLPKRRHEHKSKQALTRPAPSLVKDIPRQRLVGDQTRANVFLDDVFVHLL